MFSKSLSSLQRLYQITEFDHNFSTEKTKSFNNNRSLLEFSSTPNEVVFLTEQKT